MKSHYINGRWCPPTTDDRTPVTDPATNLVVGSAPAGGTADVDAAVAAARAAFADWAATSRAERARLLGSLNQRLRLHAEELARLIETEMGAPGEFALSEHVGTPIAIIDDCVAQLAHEPDEERIGNSLITREPIGVVAAILPWNYPLYQLVAKVVPALAAGCTVVAKPAELTPLATHRFAELLDEVGFPAGVFNLVFGTGPLVGDAMSRHPDVDMVSFTGSTRAGSLVSQAAAPTIKRVALELGGKSASLVTPDADLEQAVTATVRYCMTNSGQCCNAWTRLIAPRSARDEVTRIAARVAAEIEPELGPLVSRDQYARVQSYVAAGLDAGATLITGGPGHPDGRPENGNHAKATVFGDVRPDMAIAQEEIFGPVLVILSYDTLDEAIALANDSRYGLHGGVWAATTEAGLAIARRLRTGQVDVNGAEFNIAAPFGGYKQSGNGRELGRYGLEEFLETKAIQLV
ncbi:aldehyde dehydrogenase family protein [Streptomyces sp. NPDC048282]|uniref:aldehyde dehydrogenase family protein n=1 Tax=unclassified Streptomyces TaxID=2593676 RepID=UPI003723EB05